MSPHVVRSARPLPLLAGAFAATALLQTVAALALLSVMSAIYHPVPAYLGALLVLAFVLRRLAAARRGWERTRRVRAEVRFLAAPLPTDTLDACVERADQLFGEGLVYGMVRWIGRAAPVQMADEPERDRRSYLFSRALRPLRPTPLNADPLLLLVAGFVWYAGGLPTSLPGLRGLVGLVAVPIVAGGVLRWMLRARFDALCDALALWTLEAGVAAAAEPDDAPKAYHHTAVYRARAWAPAVPIDAAVSPPG